MKYEILTQKLEIWSCLKTLDSFAAGLPGCQPTPAASQPTIQQSLVFLCLYSACHLRFYHTLNYSDCFCTSVCTCILFCSFLCFLLFLRGVCALLLILTFSQGLVIWIMVSTLVGSGACLRAPCPFSLRCGLLTGYLKVRHT